MKLTTPPTVFAARISCPRTSPLGHVSKFFMIPHKGRHSPPLIHIYLWGPYEPSHHMKKPRLGWITTSRFHVRNQWLVRTLPVEIAEEVLEKLMFMPVGTFFWVLPRNGALVNEEELRSPLWIQMPQRRYYAKTCGPNRDFIYRL